MQKFQVLRFNVTLLINVLINMYFNEQNQIILRKLTNCIK